LQKSWDKRANKALHWTGIPLRSIPASELCVIYEVKMEKEWCTYSWQWKTLPEAVGKIVKEYNGGVEILYSEGQQYSAQCWDINYIQRFDTLEEAFEYMWGNRPSYDTRIDRDWTKEGYWAHLQYSFPSYFNNNQQIEIDG